jgi:hypothetical protein
LEDVDIFYGTWDILRPFGTFCVHLVRFFQFWYHIKRKIWQPCCRRDVQWDVLARPRGVNSANHFEGQFNKSFWAFCGAEEKGIFWSHSCDR